MPRSPVPLPRRWLPPTELVWLVGAVLTGLVLRWLCLGRLAIEHHDEAVYASNLLFGPEAGSQFPGRPFYAPPQLPLLIETTTLIWMGLGLPRTSWLPMLPGLIAGTLLIPSVWWVGRRWFGPVAGLVTAWIVALSGFHAYYARTALTDPLLVLWLLWAVYWAWVALGDGQTKFAIFAGLFTALAWGTKYTGWLPLAIAISGGLCSECLLPARERNWLRLGRTLAVMTGVTWLLWLPIWWDCQSVGGYAAVAANHRGYLQGWSTWGSNWWQQNANVAWYDATWSTCGWGFSAVVAWLYWRDHATLSPFAILRRALPVVLIGAVLCQLGYPLAGELWCGGWAVSSALIAWRRGTLSPGELRAGCLLSAWFAGLFLTTPLYQSYPRLMLPMWLAGSLGVGWWWRRCEAGSQPANATTSSMIASRPALLCAVLIPLLAGVGAAFWEPLAGVWERRTGTSEVARALRQELTSDPARTVVYVYGDPGLFFELTQAGYAASPRGDLQVTRVPQADDTLLIPGWNAESDKEFFDQWIAVADRLELVAELPVSPSSLVRLDAVSPAELRRERALSPPVYRVYRVR